MDLYFIITPNTWSTFFSSATAHISPALKFSKEFQKIRTNFRIHNHWISDNGPSPMKVV